MLDIGTLVGYKFYAFGKESSGIGKILGYDNEDYIVLDLEDEEEWRLDHQDIIMARIK